MRRRELILLVGGAMTAVRSTRAQQKTMPVIDYLDSASPGPFAPYLAAFHQGLSETGYVEGKNLAIEYRWAEGRYDQLPALAADLVGRGVDVIATNGTPPVLAAKTATSTIPIVFSVGGDPVEKGLVANLARPGGKPHGRQLHDCRAESQAAGAAVRAGSPGRGDCPAREPEQSEHRAQYYRRAVCGTGEGGCSSLS
jgi:putative tryptophan/tyrosine transport system substrate-binding protein